MKKLTKSSEDYLEAVYMLEIDSKKIQSVAIAKMLFVSKPAVNRAMNELFNAGLIAKSDYSDISLTDEGRKKAKQIYHKHTAIKEFLINLGVDGDTAECDSCKIEHVISPQTLKCIKEFNKKQNHE